MEWGEEPEENREPITLFESNIFKIETFYYAEFTPTRDFKISFTGSGVEPVILNSIHSHLSTCDLKFAAMHTARDEKELSVYLSDMEEHKVELEKMLFRYIKSICIVCKSAKGINELP